MYAKEYRNTISDAKLSNKQDMHNSQKVLDTLEKPTLMSNELKDPSKRGILNRSHTVTLENPSKSNNANDKNLGKYYCAWSMSNI